MNNNDFAVFILSHGRPDRIYTLGSLARSGYTGKIYIVIDNEDKSAPEYFKLYGDQVVQFDKLAIAQTFDQGDNFNDRRAIIYARNACFKIAADLGVKYFIQLDDDYQAFQYRFNYNYQYQYHRIRNLDKVFQAMVNYYKKIPALSVAMAQGGDFIGGAESTAAELKIKRIEGVKTLLTLNEAEYRELLDLVGNRVFKSGMAADVYLTLSE